MTDRQHHPLSADAQRPGLAEATAVWFRIGLLSFGGPAAQIALMHKEIVEDRRWLTEAQYLNALSFCMLLPGPEAMQLATYAGWRLHGTWGGLIAGLLFVLPGALIIAGLATVYHLFGQVPLVEGLFYGIKAAVLVIVIEALLRVARKALITPTHWCIAGAAFVGLFALSIPYPAIIALAALAGVAAGFGSRTDTSATPTRVPFGQTAGTIATWLAIWLLPLFGLATLSAPPLLLDLGQFFSKLAVVSFGGAYAVLAYMAQEAVTGFGWLTAREMVDALGLAETTPGPLILVTQFVGFLAAAKEGGLALGFAGAAVVLWVTFTPCFLWIFAGAPYIEWISAQPRLKAALQGITAAIVGVILNLSVWFALHILFAEVRRETLGPVTLWQPSPASVEWLALALFVLSGVMAFRFRWGIIRILCLAACVGAGARLIL